MIHNMGSNVSSFKFKHGLLEKYKPAELKKWIKATASKLLLYYNDSNTQQLAINLQLNIMYIHHKHIL